MRYATDQLTALIVTDDSFQEYLLRYFLQTVGLVSILGYRPSELPLNSILEINPGLGIIDLSGSDAVALGIQIRNFGCRFPLLLISDGAGVPDDGKSEMLHNARFLSPRFAPMDLLHALMGLVGGASKQNGVEHHQPNHDNHIGVQHGGLGPVGPSQEVIFFKIGDDFKAISIKDINYFYADNKITYARVGDRNYPTNVKLKSIEESFRHLFVRIHKTFLVNVSAIDALKTRDNALLVGGELLPIGASFRKELMNRLVVLK